MTDKKTADESTTAQAKEDLNAIIKKLLVGAKKSGFVTYDEINKSIPKGQFNPEFVEDIIKDLNKKKITILESEDDVNDIVQHFTFNDAPSTYEVYNITPVSEAVYAKDMAQAVHKRILPIQPWMARIAFWFFWHLTRGKIPTCPGSWRFYSYPVLMSGEKLATEYRCNFSSQDAFQYTDGRYESHVPADLKHSKQDA